MRDSKDVVLWNGGVYDKEGKELRFDIPLVESWEYGEGKPLDDTGQGLRLADLD